MRGRRPMALYHGTQADFTQFEKGHWGNRGEHGFFFTPRISYARTFARNGGRVISAHLAMESPYRTTERCWSQGNCLDFEQAQAAGHDGYVIRPYREGTMFVVFEPDQIIVLSHDILKPPLP